VERVVWHLLAELRALLCEVLKSSIIRQTLLGAETIQLRVAGVGEAVALEGCVGGGLLLELGERVGAG
jgi:predicted alternative tryptophan synthase beta-subunit